jgi:hypothetical protein
MCLIFRHTEDRQSTTAVCDASLQKMVRNVGRACQTTVGDAKLQAVTKEGSKSFERARAIHRAPCYLTRNIPVPNVGERTDGDNRRVAVHQPQDAQDMGRKQVIPTAELFYPPLLFSIFIPCLIRPFDSIIQ